jgi:hypothetical protein
MEKQVRMTTNEHDGPYGHGKIHGDERNVGLKMMKLDAEQRVPPETWISLIIDSDYGGLAFE